MPIQDFAGETFVAYVDISGFKSMMRQGRKRHQRENPAWRALHKFYNAGYGILRDQPGTLPRVEGIFVSDCAVLFVNGDGDAMQKLQAMLKVIEKLNRKMIREDYMLTTSITYGPFKYQNRLETHAPIRKEAVYGDAYVAAYLDNEAGSPKMQPGECGLLEKGLPEPIRQRLQQNERQKPSCILKKKASRGKYYYFYWMLPENCDDVDSQIRNFDEEYKRAQQAKCDRMRDTLKRFALLHDNQV